MFHNRKYSNVIADLIRVNVINKNNITMITLDTSPIPEYIFMAEDNESDFDIESLEGLLGYD